MKYARVWMISGTVAVICSGVFFDDSRQVTLQAQQPRPPMVDEMQRELGRQLARNDEPNPFKFPHGKAIGFHPQWYKEPQAAGLMMGQNNAADVLYFFVLFEDGTVVRKRAPTTGF
jgi:hypothetical protein